MTNRNESECVLKKNANWIALSKYTNTDAQSFVLLVSWNSKHSLGWRPSFQTVAPNRHPGMRSAGTRCSSANRRAPLPPLQRGRGREHGFVELLGQPIVAFRPGPTTSLVQGRNRLYFGTVLVFTRSRTHDRLFRGNLLLSSVEHRKFFGLPEPLRVSCRKATQRKETRALRG